MVRSRSAVVVLCLLVSGAAFANGGPLTYSGRDLDYLIEFGAGGDLTPLRASGIQLVSEDLRITIGSDGASFTAFAKYELANAGARTAVLYGVPLEGTYDEETGELNTGAAGLPDTVKIHLAGERQRCLLAARPLDDARKPAEESSARLPWDDRIMREKLSWCVAELRVPSGVSIPLTLEFTSSIASNPNVDPETLIATQSPGTFEYALFPAGWWSGAPERLTVELDAGRFAGHVDVVSPEGFRWNAERSRATLELARPDLERLKAIVVRVDTTPVADPLRLAKQNLSTFARYSARASSTLRPQGKTRYDAARAIDHDPASAWCAGAKGPGIGEWLEVTVDWGVSDSEYPVLGASNHWGFDETGQICGYGGILLVPGYARSAASWLDNARVRSFRIAPCSTPNAGEVIKLGDPGDARPLGSAPHTVRLDLGKADRMSSLVRERRPGKACFRLTILEIEPGRRWQDTCVSEFTPLITCRFHPD